MLPVSFFAYIDWHYLEMWPKVLTIAINLSLFPFFYFSIPHHLKTFLSPWKKQLISKHRGFQFSDILNVLSFNVFSRLIGMTVRMGTIGCGLIMTAFFSVISVVLVSLWPFLPFLTLPIYLKRKEPAEEAVYTLIKNSGGSVVKALLLLLDTEEGIFICRRLNISPEYIKNTIRNFPSSGDFNAFKQAIKSSGYVYLYSDVFAAAYDSFQPFADCLTAAGIEREWIIESARWFEKMQQMKETPLLLDSVRIRRMPGIGSEWSYGYTPRLDDYSADLSRIPAVFPLLVGREQEIGQIERIMIKTTGNNVLIVGEPGVARHMLVETIAHKIKTGACPGQLYAKRILSLNMNAILGSKPTLAEVKSFLTEILEEAEYAGNVIIVIDDFDRFLSRDNGKIDLTDLFTKFAQSQIAFIGIADPASFHKYIEPNPELSMLFEKVDIFPPDIETVRDELELAIVPVLEKKHGATVTYQALAKTIADAGRYISRTPFPAKAIELLDQSCVYLVTLKKGNILTAAHVDAYLEERLHIPVSELTDEEKMKLTSLESILHERLVNQEEAVKAIGSSLRRARLDLSRKNKPAGSFLFLGPTGVGKTETAKALARVFFGGADKMIRFDMSEFNSPTATERLIGSPVLGFPGELTSALTDAPFTVLLLDEFEKADRKVQNLFLTLLDEGYITSGAGKKTDCKNTMVIATSNAGAELIRENIRAGMQYGQIRDNLLEYVQKREIFSPEFLNRFDAVTVFTPLSEGHMRQVTRLLLMDLNNRLNEKKIALTITPELVRSLTSKGFDLQFGARAIQRTIQDTVEDAIAKKILSGEVKKGDTVRITI